MGNLFSSESQSENKILTDPSDNLLLRDASGNIIVVDPFNIINNGGLNPRDFGAILAPIDIFGNRVKR